MAALAEPVHGAAPDIAGQGISNPSGAMLSAAMLLRQVWGRPREAQAIETAVYGALTEGIRTPDVADGGHAVDTEEFTQAVLARIENS